MKNQHAGNLVHFCHSKEQIGIQVVCILTLGQIGLNDPGTGDLWHLSYFCS